MSQQINLFNPVFRQQKKYFSAMTMLQALGMILLGASLLVAYANYRSTRLSAEAAAAEAQANSAQEQLVKLSAALPARQKSSLLAEQLRKTEAEMASLEKTATMLKTGELGNTTGYAEYLRAFARQIVNGLWLTGFSIQGAGSEISLQGRTLRAELVPEYINRLKREPIMQGKSFSALEMRLPQSETANSSGNAKVPPSAPVAAGYIEFSLQSAALTDRQTEAAAARKQ